MKVIIAGSRHMPLESYHLVGKAVAASGFKITEVVCGMARGADSLGWKWAIEFSIPVKKFPAQWDKYGRGAGPIRNKQMADYADALIVFIYNNSRGSANMLKQMRDAGKPCFVVQNGRLPT